MHKLPKLDLNITNDCNYRCTHCAFDSGEKKMRDIPLAKIKELLIDTKSLGGERFDITGGEPTLRPDLEGIVLFGKSLGYKIELVTNGSLLSREKLVRLKGVGLDSVTISLDGPNYESYSEIRKVHRTTYERVLKNITEAVGLGFAVKINTIAAKNNYERIPELTEFCIKAGIKEHGIYYFTPIGRGECGGLSAVEPVEWLRFVREKLLRYDDKIKMRIEIPLIEKGMLKKEFCCLAESERYHMQILPDGKVYPCAIAASYDKPIADLNKTRISGIWNNQFIWNSYWGSLNRFFNENNSAGYCVNFSGFKMQDYKYKYDLVCPLRKFSPGDLSCEGA